jgi:hypothetical protein
MAGHQNDHARLLPAFRISAKMRRYLVRLRVSSGDFDQADPEREARYKKSGCEMMAILVHHRKKRIPLGAATQATCDALHAAAQLQFAGDQRDEVRRSRDQSIDNLAHLIEMLKKVAYAISELPKEQRAALDSTVAESSHEFFDTETLNSLLETIENDPAAPLREDVRALRQLWDDIPGEARALTEAAVRIRQPLASASIFFRRLAELLNESRPRLRRGRLAAVELKFVFEVAGIWKRMGLRPGISLSQKQGESIYRESTFQRFCNCALAAFGDSRRVSRHHVIKVKRMKMDGSAPVRR